VKFLEIPSENSIRYCGDMEMNKYLMMLVAAGLIAAAPLYYAFQAQAEETPAAEEAAPAAEEAVDGQDAADANTDADVEASADEAEAQAAE